MEIAVTGIFILLVASIVYKFLKEKKYSNESALGSIASTIGVLGTFIGIAIGLWKFNPNNITESVPLLLTGMKIAFATSIAGMSAAILMKYIALKKEDEENIDDIMELFNTMISESRNVNATLVQNQVQIEDVLNKVSELWSNNQQRFTKELANEIINLNNNTISKQEELITEFKKLGETFKELNSGVSGLLKWQENYKETIESNTKELNLVLESIHNTDESIKSIAKNSSLIKENNENLSKALKDIRSSQEVIVDGTKSIIQISDKAKESIPEINKYFEHIDIQLKDVVDNLDMVIHDNSRKLEKHLEKITSESLSKTTRCIADNNMEFRSEVEEYLNRFKMIVYNLKKCVPEINNNLYQTSHRFNKALTTYNNEVQKSLQQNLKQLNKQVDSLQKSTDSINYNLENTISDSTKRIENLSTATSNQIKIMIEDMENIFTRKVEQLDETLEAELTKSLNSLGSQLITISEKFANDYTPLADKLKEVVTIAEGAR
ncbi:hypothetical protein EAI30_07000 [Romboutsia ilealis]|uniref:MotA/TolQ/ExbB proton channel domain-containing protein n=1 Tax=Romboutsia faecis TaxID=2764597 RepID=A0ABR7JKE7_9FIRM|nr:hypothetical protein [Romboutsia faecis]MBC5995398.1 hypothetical protein [Romboutsia faecis]MRN24360.1 hypothetical protein [Romboutsia ilealis]